jgi:hypothetical protein
MMKLRAEKVIKEQFVGRKEAEGGEKWEKRCLAPGQELVRDTSSNGRGICGCYYCPCTANGTAAEEPKKSGRGKDEYNESGSETPSIATDKDDASEGGPGEDSDVELESDSGE